MDRLVSTGPLDGVAAIACDGVGLMPLAMMPMAELRGMADLLASALPGPGLPGPNRVADHGGWRLLWIRPDGWLMIGRDDGAARSEPLRQREGEGGCRLTDMTHGFAAIRITGRHARDLLSKGTPLDLRPLRFVSGQCAHTWCAGFRILIEARDEGLDLYVDAALALAFWSWLADAATEFKGTE